MKRNATMKMRTGLAVGSVVVLAAIGASLAIEHALADGPPTMEPLVYAGTLVDGATPVDGTRTMGIVLWTDSAGTASTQRACATAPAATQVTGGRFRVVLDASCSAAVHANPDLWVELSVDGTVMPRSHLGAVPYALGPRARARHRERSRRRSCHRA